jgi:hypothetical protein
MSTTFDYQQKILNGHLSSTSFVGANFQSSRCIRKRWFFKQKICLSSIWNLSISHLTNMYLYSCIIYCQEKVIRGNSLVLQKKRNIQYATIMEVLYEEEWWYRVWKLCMYNSVCFFVDYLTKCVKHIAKVKSKNTSCSFYTRFFVYDPIANRDICIMLAIFPLA